MLLRSASVSAKAQATLTDFGAVSAVTEGISYTPNDGISNRCI